MIDMQTSQRWAAKTSPRDLTRTKQQALLAEKAQREKEATVDLYKLGYDAGFDSGYDVGVAAVIKQLQADGVIDADEPVEPQDEVAE